MELPDYASLEVVYNRGGAFGEFELRKEDRMRTYIVVVPSPCAGRTDTTGGRRASRVYGGCGLSHFVGRARIGTCALVPCDDKALPRIVCRAFDRVNPERGISFAGDKCMRDLFRMLAKAPPECKHPAVLLDEEWMGEAVARGLLPFARKVHLMVVSKSEPRSAPGEMSSEGITPVGEGSAGAGGRSESSA
jgi:hypothetical protein